MTKEEWNKKADEVRGFFWSGYVKYPISQFEEVLMASWDKRPLPTPKLPDKKTKTR